MKEPRLNTKCRRCGELYGAHLGKGPENERRCPWTDGTFKRNTPHRGGSQSFTDPEIVLLDQVLRGLLKGSDVLGIAARHGDTLAKLGRKTAGMKRTAAARKVAP
jgi:hypothetical protein